MTASTVATAVAVAAALAATAPAGARAFYLPGTQPVDFHAGDNVNMMVRRAAGAAPRRARGPGGQCVQCARARPRARLRPRARRSSPHGR